MAIKSSFKQECPSCEAMVPIRDTALIGKKIDCPKCMKRFVVDAPEDDEAELVADADDTPAPTKKTSRAAITATPNGKGKPAAKAGGKGAEKASPKGKGGKKKDG